MMYQKNLCQVVGVEHAGHHLSTKAVLIRMTLQQRHGKASQPTQVVAQSPLARAAVVLVEVHVQHSVHRLDAPMASHRLREPLPAERTTAEIITHLVRLRAVGMPRDPHRVADRLHPRPVLTAREITRYFRDIIVPIVDAAVPVLMRLVGLMLEVFQVAFQVIEEGLLDRRQELRLIVLDGDNAVAATGDDLLDDLFLTAHRIDRDQRTLQVDLLQKLRNGGDLVGFGVSGDLAQRDPLLGGPGADDVQCTEVLGVIARAATGLAVDGDETIGLTGVGQDRVADSGLKTALEGFGLEHDERATNAVA